MIGIEKQDKHYIKLIQDDLEIKNILNMGVSCLYFNDLSDKHVVPGIEYRNDELMRKMCSEHDELMRKKCAEHEHSLQRERFLNLTHAQSMQDIASAEKTAFKRTTSVRDIKTLDAIVVSFLAERPAKKVKICKACCCFEESQKGHAEGCNEIGSLLIIYFLFYFNSGLLISFFFLKL